jgi:His Kinase A (phospho-acceptor) domain/Histidine kinase-, DNA gyrase B-, and HSP90-like ATPase
MLNRIEQGVAEQRRLVADASHELRTPLAIMRAELEVGLAGIALPPAAAELLQSSAEEVARMSRVVDDLLTLARADEEGLQLAREPVDLDEVATAVAGKLRPMADAKGIALSVQGDAPTLLADRARIGQVMANQVDNAVKYTAAGGRVGVSVWGEPGTIRLAVRDTGPASPPRRCRGSSTASSASTRPARAHTVAAASAWRSARESWRRTAGGSGRRASPGTAARSSSRSRSSRAPPAARAPPVPRRRAGGR